MINPEFYGTALAFPFRVHHATGGLTLSEGRQDDDSISLQYLGDRYTLFQVDTSPRGNAIGESILHITTTIQGEHDTLPWFGGQVHHIVFDPNHAHTRLLAEEYFCTSTKRWEHRAWIEEPNHGFEGGIEWHITDHDRNMNRVGLSLRPTYLKQQTPENLVHPFVTARQARLAEYPSAEIDSNGHDYESPYYGEQTYTADGKQFLRIRPPALIPKRNDDIFDEVRPLDTWLLISYRNYQEIRWWRYIHQCYVQDAAARGEPRDVMWCTHVPEPGTPLRMPSRNRILMELAA